MIRLILEKELRLTLLTFRFAACSLLLLLLMAASTGVLVLDWRQQVDRFEAGSREAARRVQQATAYVAVTLQVERRPDVLKLINQGIGDHFGRAVTVSGKYDVPRVLAETSESSAGRGLLPVDFSHLVGILLSLVALVFTYDLINGDRAQGTLQMTLAGSVPRSRLLFGKYLGALLGLLAPFMAAVLIWLLVLATATGAEIGTEAWARIGAALLLSLLYASGFLWLGLLASTLTAKPSTALIFALLLWTSLVVIYPPAVNRTVGIARPLPELTNESAPKEKISQDEVLRARVEATRWEVVQRAAQQYRTARILMRLSPSAAYDFATSALAGTDLDSHLALLSAARRTDEELRSWQREKEARYPDRVLQMNIPSPLDLSALPVPQEPREALSRTFQRILPDVLLLVFFNLILMTASHVAFQRYDVRL